MTSTSTLCDTPVEVLNEDLLFHDPPRVPVVMDETINKLAAFTLPPEARERMAKMEFDLKVRQGGVLQEDGWHFNSNNIFDPPPTPEEEAHVADYSMLLIKLEQTGLPLLKAGEYVEFFEKSLADMETDMVLIESKMNETETMMSDSKKQRSEKEILDDERWIHIISDILGDKSAEHCDNSNSVSKGKEKLQKMTEVCSHYQACVATIELCDIKKAIEELTEVCSPRFI